MKYSVFNNKKKIRCKKKQESTAQTKEQNKSIQNIPEVAKVSDLLDKDFKTT